MPELHLPEAQSDGRDGNDAKAEAELSRLRLELAAVHKQCSQFRAASTELIQQLRRAEAALMAQRQHNEQLAAALQAIESSEAWRMTASVRLLAARTPGMVRRAKSAARLAQRMLALAHVLPRRRPSLRLTPVVALPALPPIREQEVDIIICVHNALDDVRRCLASVLRCTLPPYNIILIDDGSDPPTQEFLVQFAVTHRAMVIRHDTSRGYTKAANAGLRAGGAPMAALLNSDTEVTEGWLDRLFDLLARRPEAAAAGPLSNTASWQSVPRLMEGEDWAANDLEPGCTVGDMARMIAEGANRRGIAIGFLNGFCLLLRREALDAVGLFDEEVFGEGFGEENDLCIRLRQAGWSLLVADDVYVLHRQSRSYGHERRLALARRADAALSAKYDWTRDIGPFVRHAQDSLLLEHTRQRLATAQAVRRLVAATGPAYLGKRIGIILPAGEANGGANVIIQEAVSAARFGADVWIFNVAALEPGFRRDYPALPLPLLCAPLGRFGAFIAQMTADLGLDALVATSSSTFTWLPPARPGLTLAYYIQDHETRFFAAGSSEQDAAIRSYRERPEVRRVTKTRWNADAVGTSADIPRAVVLGPSIDLARCAPLQDPRPDDAAIHITAMVRPATPRRNPERTLATLRGLKDRFGAQVTISCFGAPQAATAALGVRLDGITCHGALDPAHVATLLGHTDVFLDLSEWQAMGLTALEALASGAAVVVPQQGGADEVTAGAALAVDTADASACLAAAASLVTDQDLRQRLRRAGLQRAALFPPEQAAVNLLQALFAS
jgi:GT2 family glycosyltransferase